MEFRAWLESNEPEKGINISDRSQPFYIGDNGKWGYPLTDPERTKPRLITNRGIVIRNIAESSEPDLAYLLGPAGSIPQIGPERQVGDPRSGSVKFLSPHGSYRYVQYVDGKPASAIQIVSRDGRNGQVANVYTLPEFRKQGLARGLLDRARMGFDKITHSRDLSTLGAIWKGKVEESNAETVAQIGGPPDYTETGSSARLKSSQNPLSS